MKPSCLFNRGATSSQTVTGKVLFMTFNISENEKYSVLNKKYTERSGQSKN